MAEPKSESNTEQNSLTVDNFFEQPRDVARKAHRGSFQLSEADAYLISGGKTGRYKENLLSRKYAREELTDRPESHKRQVKYSCHIFEGKDQQLIAWLSAYWDGPEASNMNTVQSNFYIVPSEQFEMLKQNGQKIEFNI